MGRAPCCAKVGLRKGRWSAEEDQILINYIRKFGEGSWRSLPKKAGLLRCGKSCRLRWVNYLRSGIKRGNISTEERERIIQLHSELGNRWSLIASKMPGRTDNEIKNYWNTHLSKKLHTLDTPNFAPEKEVKSPQTHSDILLSSSSSSSTSTSSSLLSTSSKTCNFASCASTSRESDVSLEYDVAPDEATPTNAHNDNNEQDKNNEEEGDKKNKNNSERCMDACCLPFNFDMELQSPPPLLDHFDFEFEFRVAQEFEFGMDEENNNDHLWPF